MLSIVHSAGLSGIDGFPVGVECDTQDKIPRFEIIGLPGTAIKESKDRVTSAMGNSGFLDLRQQSLVKERYRYDSAVEFYGGYEDAERRICVFKPEWISQSAAEYFADNEEDNPIVWIRAYRQAGSRALSHRDYLGSLVGMGLKREKIGDILVREDGADIAVLRDISEFLLYNYEKAGRTSLKLEIVSSSDIKLPPLRFKEISDTVASLRLDSVLSSAFGISRAKAAEAVRKGITFVNSSQIVKPDFNVNEGDRLVIRGLGKARLAEIGGNSKKGRTYIKIEKYL